MPSEKALKEKRQKREEADFVKLSKTSAPEVRRNLREFHELCIQLNRINELDCNEGESRSRAREEAKLVEQAKLIAGKLGCELHHQGDPRGPAIRLKRPDNHYNVLDRTWYVEERL